MCSIYYRGLPVLGMMVLSVFSGCTDGRNGDEIAMNPGSDAMPESVDGVMRFDTRKHNVSKAEIIGPKPSPIETVFQVILVADCGGELSVLECSHEALKYGTFRMEMARAVQGPLFAVATGETFLLPRLDSGCELAVVYRQIVRPGSDVYGPWRWFKRMTDDPRIEFGQAVDDSLIETNGSLQLFLSSHSLWKEQSNMPRGTLSSELRK